MSTRPPRRTPLSRASILGAALRVIDERGLDACTMRAVAATLGVEAMSLYHHVEGKDALLDGVVELVLSELEPASDGSGWREGLTGFAHRYRDLLRRHPNVVPLLASRPAVGYAAAARVAAPGLASLEAAGFDRRTAIRAARTITRYVVGFALAESAGPPAAPPRAPGGGDPAVAALLEALASDSPDELFAFGLDTLMDGLAARLSRSRGPGAPPAPPA